MVSMPVGFAALPGASVPPLMIVVAGPTVPMPDSLPPEFTVTLLVLAIEPSTSSVPALMGAIYLYLSVVFELVASWVKEGRAVNRAHRALHLRGQNSLREPEPFAALILCTTDPEKVDDRTRSKWSRVLRYAAEFKALDEALDHFIKRKGGINECASRFARRLGRGSLHLAAAWKPRRGGSLSRWTR
jgi:hypothetical protein